MKSILASLLILLFLFFSSCQQATTQSLFAPEKAETKDASPKVKDTLNLPQQTPLDSDTTNQNQGAIDSTDSLISIPTTTPVTTSITFTDSLTLSSFEKLLLSASDSLRTEILNGIYTITYLPSLDSLFNAPAPLSPFESALTSDSTGFNPTSSLTILTPFSDMSHLEPLFYTQSYRGITLKKRSSTLTIKDTITPINAFTAALELTQIANATPSEINGVVTSVLGLSQVATQKDKIVRGINPTSKTALELNYKRTAPSLAPALLQLLPVLGYPYRSTHTGTENTTKLSYIGPDTLSHVASIEVVHTTTTDPLIELSMGNGDGLIVYTSKQLGLIKSRFSSLNLTQIDSRLYFLALENLTLSQRAGVLQSLQTAPLLQSAKMSVTPIDKLTLPVVLPPSDNALGTSDSLDLAQSLSSSTDPITPAPVAITLPTDTIRVLVNPEDALAVSLGREVVAQLLARGLTATLQAQNYREYQVALTQKSYTIALATTSQKLAQTSEGKSFIAQKYWKNSEANESQRVLQKQQLPLFQVPVYLALKNHITIPNQRLRSLYVTP